MKNGENGDMSVSPDDIQIFITTHNREAYLKHALESLLTQTVQVQSITVLDNESTDNTEELVMKYADRGVSYVRTNGFLGNFNKARDIAAKSFIMLFHDDDILHPGYVELALRALNRYDGISLITSRYTEFEGGNVPEFSDGISSAHYFFDSKRDFAKHMYFFERIAYAPAIYRTEDFLKTPLEYEKYSKFNDWPFMVKIAGHGKTVLFADRSLFLLRRHGAQDSSTNANVPSLQQIVNWDKCFYEAMNIRPGVLSIENWMFRLKCGQFMEGKYRAFLPAEEKEKHSIGALWETAHKAGLHPWTAARAAKGVRSVMKCYARIIALQKRRNAL